MTSPSDLRRSETAHRLLCIVVVGFLLSLTAGMLVPVYSDETGWRFLERAGIDAFDGLFSDVCGLNTIAKPPWYIMPVRRFSAATNSAFAAPVFVRMAGVACALTWAGLLWLLLSKLEADKKRRLLLGVAAFGLLGLGTLPFLLTLSRPEQPLILSTILMLLIVFSRPPQATGPKMAALKVMGILALSVIAQSYHMKGVLYASVAFAAILVCARGRATIAPRMVGILALVALAVCSAAYWTGRVRCPDDERLAAMYGRENIVSTLFAQHDFFDVTNMLASGVSPLNYVKLAVPTANPMSHWLTPGLIQPAVSTVFAVILFIFWTFAIGCTLLALGHSIKIRSWTALAEPRLVLATSLLGVVTVWGVSQLNRNVYEAAHVLPALVLAMILSLTLPTVPWSGVMKWLQRAAVVLMPTALMSQVVILASFGPPLFAQIGQTEYIDDQPFSVPIGNYAEVRRSIASAMQRAGIPSDRRLNRVLVDEMTYFALHDSRMPLHRLGVLSVWNGNLKDPVAYLRSRNSDGIVLGCHHLDERLRKVAAKSGPICAVSRTTLNMLAQI